MKRFNVNKLANSDIMQAYIESLSQFGLTRTKLLTFLNWSRSIFGWTILSQQITSQSGNMQPIYWWLYIFSWNWYFSNGKVS